MICILLLLNIVTSSPSPMLLIVIPIEIDQGWARPEAGELQAKVNFFLGCGGKSFGEVLNLFLDCCEFDILHSEEAYFKSTY